MLLLNQMPKVVYLTPRRHPRKRVTLTLLRVLTPRIPVSQSLEALHGQMGKWAGGCGQPGLAEPTRAFSYLFIFAHFKKAERNMGSILEHG